MNPESAKAAKAAAPDTPADPEDAVIADPGEQHKIEQEKKEKKRPDDSSENGESHYIAIELKDEDGNAVGGKEYKIELPGGDVASGYLDDEGKAKVAGIPVSGQCKVSFPDIHGDEWVAK